MKNINHLFIPNSRVIRPFGIQYNKGIYFSKTIRYAKSVAPLEVFCPIDVDEISIRDRSFYLSSKEFTMEISNYRELSKTINVVKGSFLGTFGKYQDGSFITDVSLQVSEEFLQDFKQHYEIKPYDKRYLMNLFDLWGLSYPTGSKLLEDYCIENGIKEFNSFYLRQIDTEGNESIYFNYLGIN